MITCIFSLETNSMEILLVSFQTPPLSLSKNDSTPTIISESVALDDMLLYSVLRIRIGLLGAKSS